MIISLRVNNDIKCNDLLLDMKTAFFFPDGQSSCSFIGTFDQYNFAVVNVANDKITADFAENFTLWNYLEKHKATTGKARFHLFYTENYTVETVETSAAEDTATMDSQTGPSPIHNKAAVTDSQTQPSSVQKTQL